MKETFKVSVVNTRTQSRTDLESNAVTLAELKRDLSNAGIDYSGMTFMEGSTKVELKDDSSILPTNVPVKRNGTATGETTNDLVFFLTTPNKNIKSGAMSRAEAYEFMKENPELAAAFKNEHGGKNYTNATTVVIVEFIESFTAPAAETVTPDCEVASPKTEACVCPILHNVMTYVASLEEAGVLDQKYVEGFKAIFNGEDAPVIKQTYSDYDIDKMYGDWMN